MDFESEEDIEINAFDQSETLHQPKRRALRPSAKHQRSKAAEARPQAQRVNVIRNHPYQRMAYPQPRQGGHYQFRHIAPPAKDSPLPRPVHQPRPTTGQPLLRSILEIPQQSIQHSPSQNVQGPTGPKTSSYRLNHSKNPLSGPNDPKNPFPEQKYSPTVPQPLQRTPLVRATLRDQNMNLAPTQRLPFQSPNIQHPTVIQPMQRTSVVRQPLQNHNIKHPPTQKPPLQGPNIHPTFTQPMQRAPVMHSPLQGQNPKYQLTQRPPFQSPNNHNRPVPQPMQRAPVVGPPLQNQNMKHPATQRSPVQGPNNQHQQANQPMQRAFVLRPSLLGQHLQRQAVQRASAQAQRCSIKNCQNCQSAHRQPMQQRPTQPEEVPKSKLGVPIVGPRLDNLPPGFRHAPRPDYSQKMNLPLKSPSTDPKSKNRFIPHPLISPAKQAPNGAIIPPGVDRPFKIIPEIQCKDPYQAPNIADKKQCGYLYAETSVRNLKGLVDGNKMLLSVPKGGPLQGMPSPRDILRIVHAQAPPELNENFQIYMKALKSHYLASQEREAKEKKEEEMKKINDEMMRKQNEKAMASGNEPVYFPISDPESEEERLVIVEEEEDIENQEPRPKRHRSDPQSQKSGFKVDVELFDRMPNGDIVKGAINFWSNIEDEGGDIVVLIGVSVGIIGTKMGPFGKIQYYGSNRRRHVLVYQNESLLTKDPVAFKLGSAMKFDPHDPVLTGRNFAREGKFEGEISSRVEKLVEKHEEEMKSARKKFVVGIVEEDDNSNVPALLRIRTKDLLSKIFKNDAPETIKFFEQEIWEAKIQESLRKRNCRLETAPLKNTKQSKMITGQVFYLTLSDLAKEAIPALKEKLKPDTCIILSRDCIETIRGGNMLEYQMRWEGGSYPEGAIQTGHLSEMAFNAA
ncbi:Oidioi.mRNA.OKI2018_I69.XSR.g13311.t1.cds [Oikopleura dioica]|uniref:Oidioi.mRNA.OKI2018_I69.XSR.g13311.t1.cds n=1 Tax=Oikopleura dioica TaxID=34765 RepID=A0ABN7SB64_OIKDI|nr:Oidioi.mRNA.OKI2018_I69.XSR.g13311.t1.cds [Oikopleura dioica]